MTSGFWQCIFAMKQSIGSMKTNGFHIMLFVSVLLMCLPVGSRSQDMLLCAYRMENMTEMPSMGCFVPSCIGMRFRNDFGTKEMMYADFSGVYSQNHNSLMLYIYHYGYTGYGHLQLTGGYGRRFGHRFAVAMRFTYMMEHARNYSSRHSLCTDVSLSVLITPKVYLHTMVYNPFCMRYGIVDQYIIPLRFMAACTYMPNEKLLFGAVISKELPGAWELGGRFMIRPIPPLLIAVDCANTQLGLSVGLIYRKFVLNVQAAWCYRLALSPQISGWYVHSD